MNDLTKSVEAYRKEKGVSMRKLSLYLDFHQGWYSRRIVSKQLDFTEKQAKEVISAIDKIAVVEPEPGSLDSLRAKKRKKV